MEETMSERERSVSKPKIIKNANDHKKMKSKDFLMTHRISRKRYEMIACATKAIIKIVKTGPIEFHRKSLKMTGRRRFVVTAAIIKMVAPVAKAKY
jgi:hypothetical protein